MSAIIKAVRILWMIMKGAFLFHCFLHYLLDHLYQRREKSKTRQQCLELEPFIFRLNVFLWGRSRRVNISSEALTLKTPGLTIKRVWSSFWFLRADQTRTQRGLAPPLGVQDPRLGAGVLGAFIHFSFSSFKCLRIRNISRSFFDVYDLKVSFHKLQW